MGRTQAVTSHFYCYASTNKFKMVVIKVCKIFKFFVYKYKIILESYRKTKDATS